MHIVKCAENISGSNMSSVVTVLSPFCFKSKLKKCITCVNGCACVCVYVCDLDLQGQEPVWRKVMACYGEPWRTRCVFSVRQNTRLWSSVSSIRKTCSATQHLAVNSFDLQTAGMMRIFFAAGDRLCGNRDKTLSTTKSCDGVCKNTLNAALNEIKKGKKKRKKKAELGAARWTCTDFFFSLLIVRLTDIWAVPVDIGPQQAQRVILASHSEGGRHF